MSPSTQRDIPSQPSTPTRSWTVPNSPRAHPTWAGAAALLGSPGRAAPCPGVPASPAVTQDGVRASPAQPWQGSDRAGRRVPWGQAGRRGQDGWDPADPAPVACPKPCGGGKPNPASDGSPPKCAPGAGTAAPTGTLAVEHQPRAGGDLSSRCWGPDQSWKCHPAPVAGLLLPSEGAYRGHGEGEGLSTPGCWAGMSRSPRPAPAPGAGKGRWFGAERCPGQTTAHLPVISAN